MLTIKPPATAEHNGASFTATATATAYHNAPATLPQAKLTFDNEQQELVGAGEFIRGAFANVTSTPPTNVYWYQTRSTQGAGGKPQVQVRLFFPKKP
jgi:hypothetical protein